MAQSRDAAAQTADIDTISSAQSIEKIIAWFSQFSNFAFDTGSGLRSNFNRLATLRQWGPKIKGKRWMDCQEIAFAALYADVGDVNKLEKWQSLCREVYINNPPNSITQCRKVLGSRKVLVNLVNLIDHRLVGVPVIRFKDYDSFWRYTSKGRKYPLNQAKEDGFIKALLRHL